MSTKTGKSPSLRALKTRSSEIPLKSDDQFLLVSAPNPESALATALICTAVMKSGGAFHVSFEEPIMNIESVNSYRIQQESSTIVFVGIKTTGTKKLRKGKGYPIFVGGSSESEQVKSRTIGNSHTVSAAAYTLSEERFITGDYELQMAAAASLIYDKSPSSPKTPSSANKALLKLAEKNNLVEERGGIRLFGLNFLPIDEVLLLSTRPYIHGISGDQKSCDAFLSEADVPITKLRDPLTSLNSLEIQQFSQHLTSRLLEKMGPEKIPFGSDYILARENDSSPLRYLSGLETIADTFWARQELGATMSIWIGDRGRALRTVIDKHLSHNKDVISAVQRLTTKMKGTSSEVSTSIELSGVRAELLTDIGRVALQSEIVNPERPLVISNEDSSLILWTYMNVDVTQILPVLYKQNMHPVTTSTQSIMLKGVSPESLTETLKLVKDLSKKKR
jgi:hypothetical protein